MTANLTIVCWTPAGQPISHPAETPGEVRVARLGDDVYWSERYAFVTGSCESTRHDMTPHGKSMMMFIDFHTLVVRDGINPQVAHREFLKIEEYRKRISTDIGDPASAEIGAVA